MTRNTVLDYIGNTPLIPIDGVFVKMECSNPGGSVKDRIAKFMLQEARARGDLQPTDTVVEATSGNTGIAMAMVARELGHRVIIWMPEHMSQERIEMLRTLGADVRLTPEEEGFQGPIEKRDSYKGRDGYYVPDQFGNPDNVRCHESTTGEEIARQLRELGRESVDAFVAGTGTGGTLMGVGRALKKVMPEIRIVAVEPEESAVMLGGEPGSHSIQGIGDGFIPPLVDMDFVDEVIAVGEADAASAARRIHDEFGYCVGMSAGANTIAAQRLRARGLEVATVWPDCSDRYISMGLSSPGASDGSCPMVSRCAERWYNVIES
ncbi:MAG: cysteine synthase family protein [Acidobacteriota bacterium]|jgi:cysteine synthase A